MLLIEIITEPNGGAHNELQKSIAQEVKDSILKNLELLNNIPIDELLEQRFRKYSAMGKFAKD
jgi:acetyl-CoA carboxylase carboxyl transferase subunit alpha